MRIKRRETEREGGERERGRQGEKDREISTGKNKEYKKVKSFIWKF